jgi:hypothetical protein
MEDKNTKNADAFSQDFQSQGGFEKTDNAIDPASLVFHYKRENRISKAPTLVKSAYDGTLKKPPKGFFRALVHTKSSRVMLIVMIVVLGFTVASILSGPKKHRANIDGIAFSLSAFSFEDTIYVSLQMQEDANRAKKTIETKPEETVVQADFSFIDADGNALVQQSFEKTFLNKELFLRTTLSDYDILSVSCLLKIDEKEALVESRVDRK